MKNRMLKKLIGIVICTLLIATVVLPVSASFNENNEIIGGQKETSDDGYAVITWMVASIRGYIEYDEFYEVDFKIGIGFIFGVAMGQPYFGFIPLWGKKPVDKEGFEGILTESHIIGKLVESGSY